MNVTPLFLNANRHCTFYKNVTFGCGIGPSVNLSVDVTVDQVDQGKRFAPGGVWIRRGFIEFNPPLLREIPERFLARCRCRKTLSFVYTA